MISGTTKYEDVADAWHGISSPCVKDLLQQAQTSFFCLILRFLLFSFRQVHIPFGKNIMASHRIVTKFIIKCTSINVKLKLPVNFSNLTPTAKVHAVLQLSLRFLKIQEKRKCALFCLRHFRDDRDTAPPSALQARFSAIPALPLSVRAGSPDGGV